MDNASKDVIMKIQEHKRVSNKYFLISVFLITGIGSLTSIESYLKGKRIDPQADLLPKGTSAIWEKSGNMNIHCKNTPIPMNVVKH